MHSNKYSINLMIFLRLNFIIDNIFFSYLLVSYLDYWIQINIFLYMRCFISIYCELNNVLFVQINIYNMGDYQSQIKQAAHPVRTHFS
jgi:hypothetical protein